MEFVVGRGEGLPAQRTDSAAVGESAPSHCASQPGELLGRSLPSHSSGIPREVSSCPMAAAC